MLSTCAEFGSRRRAVRKIYAAAVCTLISDVCVTRVCAGVCKMQDEGEVLKTINNKIKN